MHTLQPRSARPARTAPPAADPFRTCALILRESLEMLPNPVALLDRLGRPLLANGLYADLLASPDGESVRDDAAALARAVALGRAHEQSCICHVDEVVSRYEMRARCVELEWIGHPCAVLLVMHRADAGELPDDVVLQARWGLTRKQARVARLLAEGRSNAEIAAELFISPHTARHHTEQVMSKLGAGSRAEVGAKLRSATR